jgi:hypothetical protein
LEELRLENCTIEPKVTRQLVDLFAGPCFIKRIGLVDAKLQDDTMDKFCAFIADSAYLEEVDISYNKLRPPSFSKLVSVLADNTQLMYLNLSWNILVETGTNYEKDRAQRYFEQEKGQCEPLGPFDES